MGLFTKKIATADVELAGIRAYAESGDEDLLVRARVNLAQRRQIGGKEPLPMLGSLGGVRLLSMLRREPHYVGAFVRLIESMAEQLTALDGGYSTRACVLTDPALQTESEFGSALREKTIELSSALPVLTDPLEGPVERTTRLDLLQGKDGRGMVQFKLGGRHANVNALTTVGAWTATVDALVRAAPSEVMAVPIGAGLKALREAWDRLGSPRGLSLREAAEVEFLVTDHTARFTPD